MKHLPRISILLLIASIVMRGAAAGMHDECFKLHHQIFMLEKIHHENPEIYPEDLRQIIKWTKESCGRKVRRMDNLHLASGIPILFGVLTGIFALIKRRPTNIQLRAFYIVAFLGLLYCSILSFLVQI